MAEKNVSPGSVVAVKITNVDPSGNPLPFMIDAVPNAMFTLTPLTGGVPALDHVGGVEDLTTPPDPNAATKVLGYRLPLTVPTGAYSAVFSFYVNGQIAQGSVLVNVLSGDTQSAAIKQELIGRRFPVAMLLDDEFNQVVKAATRKMNRYSPVMEYATFSTQSEVQDYYIFDPNDPFTAGCCENATSIGELVWNPSDTAIDDDIFGAGILLANNGDIDLNIDFQRPTMNLMFRQQLQAWRRQYGAQGFEIVGQVGDPNSFLRMYPSPQTTGITVAVEMFVSVPLQAVVSSRKDELMDWVELFTAEAIANMYAQTAGIDLLGFADSKEAMRYWANRAEKLEARALSHWGGLHGQVAVS